MVGPKNISRKLRTINEQIREAKVSKNIRISSSGVARLGGEGEALGARSSHSSTSYS